MGVDGRVPFDSPNEPFYRFLVEQNNAEIAGSIPEDMLEFKFFILATRNISNDLIPVLISSTKIDEFIADANVPLLKRENPMPFNLGSRPEYATLFVWDDSRELGSPVSISLREILTNCVALDIGVVFSAQGRMFIVEPDRVNEYARASLPENHIENPNIPS